MVGDEAAIMAHEAMLQMNRKLVLTTTLLSALRTWYTEVTVLKVLV